MNVYPIKAIGNKIYPLLYPGQQTLGGNGHPIAPEWLCVANHFTIYMLSEKDAPDPSIHKEWY